MNHRQIEKYLEELPKFSPKTQGRKPFSLEALRSLLKRLDDPQAHIRIVHVAGTNGKGSVIAFLNSILTDSGMRTGVFTSPFLCRKEEMFRVGEEEVSEEEFALCMGKVIEEAECLKKETGLFPSEFELYTAMAFSWFRKRNCDLVLLETGLGGESDATNVIPTPELAILTPITRDHMQLLGDTVGEIASVKAGIIKEKGKVLSGRQEEEAKKVLEERCRKKNARLYRASLPEKTELTKEGQAFVTPEGKEYEISMTGGYQAENAMLAIKAAEILGERYSCISDTSIRSGLYRTKWAARFEKIGERPLVILDGSHNEAGVRAMADSLKEVASGRKVRFVVGMLEDKEWQKMLSIVLDIGECFYTFTVSNERGLDGRAIEVWLTEKKKQARYFDGWKAAVKKGLEDAGEEDVLCIFGSLYYLGEVRTYFLDGKKGNVV